MNIILLPNRILVEEIKEEKAIEVVNVQKGAYVRGRVVASSEAMVKFPFPQVGSIVHFAKHAGDEIEYEGKSYRVLFVSADRESEVLAIEGLISHDQHDKMPFKGFVAKDNHGSENNPFLSGII